MAEDVKFAKREKGGQKYRVFAGFPQNFLVAGRRPVREAWFPQVRACKIAAVKPKSLRAKAVAPEIVHSSS